MKTITREQAIDLLRPRLAEQVDDKHCLCEVAARTGTLCHGFARWSYADLKRRFWWLSLRHPELPRAEFEALANAWLVERKRRFGAELCCDTQLLERDLCKGWDEFEDAALERLMDELCGQQVKVVRAGSAVRESGADHSRFTRHAETPPRGVEFTRGDAE